MTPHPHRPLPERSSLQTSAILLIVIGFFCGGMLPAIFGIIALVQIDTDPYSAQKMNKVGWILFAVLLALALIGVILYFVLFAGLFGMAFLVGG